MSPLLFIQTAAPSLNNAEAADTLKNWGQIVAIIVGIAGVAVILATKTWPWLKAKLDSRSIRNRKGAEAFPSADVEASLRYYVTPYCQDIDPAGGEEPRALIGVKRNLFETLDDVLNQPTEYRYLILLADSGMGKTSALLNYYARHIRSSRRRRKFGLAVIPLGIPNAEEMIKAVPNKERTVLFLDALDEDTLANVDHTARVRDLLEATREFSRVVITCRTQFFPKDEEIPRETGILKVGSRTAGERAGYVFHKLYLSPFTDEQVRRYLKRRYPFWRRRRRRTAFEMVEKIPNLVVRPMLLAHVGAIIKKRANIKTSCDLYAEMVEAWLEREEPLVKKENLRRFSELLAADLYINRQQRRGEFLPYGDLAGLAKAWSIPIDEWRIGSRSLLNRDAAGNYKFSHRSIMEYLCVKRFAQGDKALSGVEWTDQMNLFLRELFDGRHAGGSSRDRINTAGWEASQCVALVMAVLQSEDRIPDQERLYRSPGGVLWALGEMMRTDNRAARGTGSDGEEFSAMMTMVKVCGLFHDLPQAMVCAEQALEAVKTIPDKIEALDALVSILLAKGQRKRAIQYCQSEMKLMQETGSPDAERIRKQLEDLGEVFEFETVNLDPSGRVLQCRKREALQVTEKLAGGIGLAMVEIPGGTFTMGSRKEERDSSDSERPQHEVTLTPFYIGKYAVTQAQWRVVAGWPKVNQDLAADPSHFNGNDRPVEQVSWEDAVEFCERLSKKTGKTYRLPTEAQWEYACRAGTATPFAFGETITPEFVNYNGQYPYGKAPKGEHRRKTVPVGSLRIPNAWGLYDMHGNVWEWCQDWYGPYRAEPVTDPHGPSEGTNRVLRGGSWNYVGDYCRSAFRNIYAEPGFRDDSLGFRVVVVSRTP